MQSETSSYGHVKQANKLSIMGRNQHIIHGYFTHCESDGKQAQSKCNECTEKVSRTSTRLKNHFRRCGACIAVHKDPRSGIIPLHLYDPEAAELSTHADYEAVENAGSASAASSSNSCIKKTKRRAQGSIASSSSKKSKLSSWVDTINPSEQNYLSLALATAILATGQPLNAVESKEWGTFFRKLRPAFKPPSRDKIGSTFLPAVHEATRKMVVEALVQCSSVGLTLDGCTTKSKRGIMNFMVTTPMPFFLQNLYKMPQRQDAAPDARE